MPIDTESFSGLDNNLEETRASKTDMVKNVISGKSSQYGSNSYLLPDRLPDGGTTSSLDSSNDTFSSGSGGGYFARTLRMTRKEVIHAMANRLLYSQFYKHLYIVMCLLSIISLVMSLVEKCPGVWFIVFESIVNLTMVIEVTIRVLALGSMYWKSVWNFFDIFIVFLCIITMFSLFFTQCSTERSNEAILDTGLLILRNGIQLGRLVSITRRNRRNNVIANPTKVDFSTISHDRWSKRYNSFASYSTQDVPYTFKDTPLASPQVSYQGETVNPETRIEFSSSLSGSRVVSDSSVKRISSSST